MRGSFNENMIKREGLPIDVFRIIHDLCYHHDGRDIASYVKQARKILRSRYGLCPICNRFLNARGKCKLCPLDACCECTNWAELDTGCGCICHKLGP